MNNIKEDVLNIIRSFILSKYDISFDGDINDLYNISNKLVVSNIVGYTLNKSGYKETIFNSSIYKAVNQYERIIDTRKDIDNILNNINYLYVKGLKIAELYPESYLRDSCDIDIVIDNNDFDKAYKLFINNGYKELSRNKNEIALRNRKGILIDLHSSFAFNDDKFDELFISTFNNTHELDNNYLYVYMIRHIKKHILGGLLKYRYLIDLYYLRNNIDKDIVDDLLSKAELTILNDSLNSYIDAFIGLKEYSDLDKKLEDFIFSCSSDKGITNRILINSYGKSKISYILSRVFISYDLMVLEYPKLRENKLFLPYFYIKRIVRIRKRNRAKYHSKELKNSLKTSKNDIDNMHMFINKIGIK